MTERERRQILPVSRELLPGASRVVEHVFAKTHYLAGALDALRSAVLAPSADARALAALRGERIEGVAVFGFFGGTSGAGRLQLVAVDLEARRAGGGAALVHNAVSALRRDGARFVLAELPDDSRALPGSRAFLESLGFREESRVDDFVRDGIALSFMRLELDRT